MKKALLLGVVLCGFITVVFSRNIFEAANNGTPEVVMAAIGRGESVLARLDEGQAPLHVAANNRNAAVLSALLLAGSDIHASGLYGRKCGPREYQGA